MPQSINYFCSSDFNYNPPSGDFGIVLDVFTILERIMLQYK